MRARVVHGAISGLVLGLALTIWAGQARAYCGSTPDICAIDTGKYHLVLPRTSDDHVPVVMFLHGAGSTGRGVMGNKNLVNSLRERGYAVIAPDGSRRFRNGKGLIWNFFPGWEGRNEAQFLRDVVADAAQQFGVSDETVLLAGFSAGGFMVNYLACADPDAFAAYAPVSGGFWRPQPENCSGPVHLLHTHGWSDKTVPIEGRFLRNGELQQGDIFAGLEIWREANGCAKQNPDSYGETGEFWRRKWSHCAPDSALELALFPGGHRLPRGWSDMALDWFEALPAINKRE